MQADILAKDRLTRVALVEAAEEAKTFAAEDHVHVRAGGCEAKLWLDPKIRVAASYGFDAGTLRELVEATQSHRALIERAWNDYFG
jgi:Domain of unknown function (DUF4160)